jgi:hypothetical protein
MVVRTQIVFYNPEKTTIRQDKNKNKNKRQFKTKGTGAGHGTEAGPY